jgi:hypothetical protein
VDYRTAIIVLNKYSDHYTKLPLQHIKIFTKIINGVIENVSWGGSKINLYGELVGEMLVKFSITI